jgi:endonuclease/exonuclease/phosphatase family metal-dependent hydrolase
MSKGEKLRILSYNIHKGFTAGNLGFVLKRIKESIRVVHADIVFLQEVLGHTEQLKFLADEVWPHHAYGKNAVYESGHHGNAILSKHPILKFENIDVSTNTLERRGLLHAEIEYPPDLGTIHAICLHLGLFEGSRRRQIEALAKRIESVVPGDAPLIVAGDFNDWRGTATSFLAERLKLREAHLEMHKTHASTFPSWMPFLKLDRIYFRNVEVVGAKSLTGRPWNALSDHAAVLAEIAMRKGSRK